MDMKKVRYIGNFPPPYGGVTRKNELIFSELNKTLDVRRNKINNRMVSQVFEVLALIFERNPLIIGVSASRRKSSWVTSLLYRCNRKTLNRSLYFMMGGLEAATIAESPTKIKQYSQYRRIYVETESMRRILLQSGVNNVSVYPNCRRRPNKTLIIRNEKKLRCVFFSNISYLKGADIVLEVANFLPNIEFYFYGKIDDDFSEEFNAKVKKQDNVFYRGVFKEKEEFIYQELNKYDVLLLPTRWKTEGVPGVIVEAKISAITAIVSDVCYNSELVCNNKEGLVVPSDNVQAIQEAIMKLDSDRDWLKELKENSLKSAERFYLDTYIDLIKKEFEV